MSFRFHPDSSPHKYPSPSWHAVRPVSYTHLDVYKRQDVDAAKCKRAGITPDAVLSTLSGYYGGQYVSNINRFSKVYKVMIQSDPKYRLDETSLNNTFVRMSNGEMAPLSQFITLTKVYGAESLARFNMYNSIAVNAVPANGYKMCIRDRFSIGRYSLLC